MNNTDKTVQTGTKYRASDKSENGGHSSAFQNRPAVKIGSPPASPAAVSSDTSFAARTLIFQGLLLAAGALIGIYLFFTLHQLLKAQSLFEAAQQQRILNQRYAKEVLLSASGVPVSYEKTAQEWSQTLGLLTQGGELRISDRQALERVQPPLDASRFKGILDQMAETRHRIIQESEGYLQAARQISHRQQLFDELYAQSLELQAAGDALVQTYDKHLDSGVSWWDVNAVAVELAERQRMLIQQHIKEVLFVAHGIPANYQATRLRLYDSVKILTEGGNIQIDNRDAITIPVPASADVRFSLEQQKAALDRFTAVSNQYLMLANEDVERSIQLKKILDLTGDFHNSATRLLTEYRGYFEARVQKASREAAAAGIVTAIFVLLLGWMFMRKYVDVPVSRMTAVLRSLRSGGSQPIEMVGQHPGPLGEMGAELDHCVRQWKSRQSWFDQFLSAQSFENIPDPGSQDPVASRVYQWYKSRESEAPAVSRWASEEKTASDITIIGRLPESDPAPLINDSELLDQLIARANELQSQNEHLLRAHDFLKEEAAALRDANSKLATSESALLNETHGLEDINHKLSAQIADQLLEIADLSAQVEGLRRSESAIASGTEEIRRVNSELLLSVDRQSDELKSLRAQWQAKNREFEAAAREHAKAEERHQSEIHELTQKLHRTESALMVLEAELSALQESRQRDDESGRIRLETLTAEHAETLQSLTDLRLQLAAAHQESDKMREAAQRDRDLIASLSHLLAEAEKGLAELKAALERSAEAARADWQAREALTGRVDSLEAVRADLERVGADQLRQIRWQETVISDLQESLSRQTGLLDSVRSEFSEASARHTVELGERERVLQKTEAELSAAQSRWAETKAALEQREADLWRIRKELLERQRDLSEARNEIERLRSAESQQSAALAEMRLEVARLQSAVLAKASHANELELRRQELEQKIFLAEAQFAEIRRDLEARIAATHDALQVKSQALTMTEDRLSATRAALKSALEELQENSKSS